MKTPFCFFGAPLVLLLVPSANHRCLEGVTAATIGRWQAIRGRQCGLPVEAIE